MDAKRGGVHRGSGYGGPLHGWRVAGRPVPVFEGRIHACEAGDAAAMRAPLTTARERGAETLLTNSTGSPMREAGPGSLVALNDHIDLHPADRRGR